MSFRTILKREYEVAFAKNAQPIWLRVVKYFVLSAVTFVLLGTVLLWIILSVLITLGLVIHFWFRHKTSGWTKDYGPWKVDKGSSNPSED